MTEQFLVEKKTFAQKYADIMPMGAGALFFIQMFSTLAFSILYSTLVLYTTSTLQLSDHLATGITASFVALNYALHLLGGYVGGRFLSYRSLFCLGMVTQVIGCALISIPTTTALYWGLATFLTGAGINVTCINCMLTQLFKPSDKRREAAFLWNYSGMNIGFFIGFTVSGYYQLQHSYQELFLFGAIGNLIALIITLLNWYQLKDTHSHLISLNDREKFTANGKGLALVLLLILALRVLLKNAHVSNSLIMMMGLLMGGVIAYFAFQQPTLEARKKVWAFLLLALTSIVFWTLYQLAPMGLMLFIERNVDRHLLGIVIAPQWVQNINTLVIIIGGPLLSIFFSSMRNRGTQLTLPIQFSVALLLIGFAFMALSIGIYFANAQGLVNFNWVIVSYILQSMGELFISPIGFAMVGQLAPQQSQGLFMGTWLMITGVSATLSGYFTNMALGIASSNSPLVTNAGFSHTFSLLGTVAILTGVGLLYFLPWVVRLTQEKTLPPLGPQTVSAEV